MQIVTTRRAGSLALKTEFELDYLVEKLTAPEQKIFELTIATDQNPKIKNHGATIDLAFKVHNIAAIRLGLKPKKVAELDILLQVLENDINRFPELTEQEILHALDSGLNGDFNPDGKIIFSSAQFVIWIKAYIEQQKKPVIKKSAQVVQQIPTQTVEPSIEIQIVNAANIVNLYILHRQRNPDHRVLYASGLYENLERLGIYTASNEEKIKIFENVLKVHRPATKDEAQSLARSACYNAFIGQLVDFEKWLDESGQIIDLAEAIEIEKNRKLQQ